VVAFVDEFYVARNGPAQKLTDEKRTCAQLGTAISVWVYGAAALLLINGLGLLGREPLFYLGGLLAYLLLAMLLVVRLLRSLQSRSAGERSAKQRAAAPGIPAFAWCILEALMGTRAWNRT
jgi:hypothetical protein